MKTELTNSWKKVIHHVAMNHVFLATLAFAGAASWLFAQGRVFSGTGKPYDPKAPPPIALSQAYSLAIMQIGTATNRFYCVSASCLERTLPEYPGWVFWFSNTNEELARVEVYFGEKGATVPDAKSKELLK